MAEKPNVRVAVFVADNTYYFICVVSGRMELLPSFLRARLFAAAVMSLSSPVLRCCFRALPGHSVDIDSFHISYADIFISQVMAAGCSLPQFQLTVDDVFWNATILHTADMTQPS